MSRPKGFQIDGRFLKAQRELAGFTQEELARRCLLTRTAVQKAERGGPLAAATIRALAEGLDCEESSLMVSQDWTLGPVSTMPSPFVPNSARKIGTIWSARREALYQLAPLHLLILALRNSARILFAYAPRTSEGVKHFRAVLEAAQLSHRTVLSQLAPSPPPVDPSTFKEAADRCYLAAAHALPRRYEEDYNAADAAFAVAIAFSRIVEGLQLEIARPKQPDSSQQADHWRIVEFGASACHAASHACVYLTVEAPFLRAATLDTHDLQSGKDPREVLIAPLWDGGTIPPSMTLFMNRMLRPQHIPHQMRVDWNRWSTKSFQ